MLPSPYRCRFGKRTGRDSSMCPNVSEPASPHSGASGIAPIPAPSSTISKIRLKGFGIEAGLLFGCVVTVARANLRLLFHALELHFDRAKLSVARFVGWIVTDAV